MTSAAVAAVAPTSAAGAHLVSAATEAVRALAGGPPHDACIAVAVRDELRPVDQPWVDELLLGMLPVLDSAGCRVVRLYGCTDEQLWTLGDYIRRWRLCGMVLVSVHSGDPLPGLLRDSGFPVVSVGRTDQPDIPCVDGDNAGGARTAVAHLAGRGRRRIAFVNGPITQRAMFDRLTGYRSGLVAAGLPVDDDRLVMETDGSRGEGWGAMTLLLERVPDLDAVLVSSEVLGAGVMETLDLFRIDVPGRVAVVQFDDGPRAGSRRITCLTQPIGRLGTDAAEMVLDVVAGREPRSAGPVPMTLEVRDSA